MNVQAHYSKSRGVVDVMVSVLRNCIDLYCIDVSDISPDTVELKRGIDPTDTHDVPFHELNDGAKEEIIEDAVNDYCERRGDKVIDFQVNN